MDVLIYIIAGLLTAFLLERAWTVKKLEGEIKWLQTAVFNIKDRQGKKSQGQFCKFVFDRIDAKDITVGMSTKEISDTLFKKIDELLEEEKKETNEENAFKLEYGVDSTDEFKREHQAWQEAKQEYLRQLEFYRKSTDTWFYPAPLVKKKETIRLLGYGYGYPTPKLTLTMRDGKLTKWALNRKRF